MSQGVENHQFRANQAHQRLPSCFMGHQFPQLVGLTRWVRQDLRQLLKHKIWSPEAHGILTLQWQWKPYPKTHWSQPRLIMAVETVTQQMIIFL